MEKQIPKNKKIYFVSDIHLGLPPREKSLAREKLLIKWLNEIQKDAFEIYLLGDIFDYWFEYKKVVAFDKDYDGDKGFVTDVLKNMNLKNNKIYITKYTFKTFQFSRCYSDSIKIIFFP